MRQRTGRGGPTRVRPRDVHRELPIHHLRREHHWVGKVRGQRKGVEEREPIGGVDNSAAALRHLRDRLNVGLDALLCSFFYVENVLSYSHRMNNMLRRWYWWYYFWLFGLE